MSTTSADDKAHESNNIAFMSSQVLNGEGYGIVVRCGDNTFIGKINSLAGDTAGSVTTLQRDINKFVKFIAAIAITMAIILFSAGMVSGWRAVDWLFGASDAHRAQSRGRERLCRGEGTLYGTSDAGRAPRPARCWIGACTRQERPLTLAP